MRALQPIRRRSPSRAALCFFLLSGAFAAMPGRADVYAQTGGDGVLKLSNVRTDNRYKVLIAAPRENPVTVSDTAPASTSKRVHYDRMIDEVARTYGLESALLHAVITVESRYRPSVVSSKGATGLMQLMPATSRHYGVADPLDPVQNLHGGAKYLRDLLKFYNNDMSLALAAYNAGPHAVAKHGNRIPPYRETASYVPRVLEFYTKYRAEARPAGK